MSETKFAHPAALGLMAFGMTTVLLNLHNSGLFPMGSMILSMGLFFGGIAQVISGIMEYRNSNMFGLTAFTAYGLFWMTLVSLIVLPELGLAQPASKSDMAAYLLIWGLFTYTRKTKRSQVLSQEVWYLFSRIRVDSSLL